MDIGIRLHTIIPVFFVYMLDVKVLAYCLVCYYVPVVEHNDNYSLSIRLHCSLRVRENIWVLWSEEKQILQNAFS